MSYVVTLVGFVPPVRGDGVPWTGVRFEESPAPSGPWSFIDAQSLPSPDVDPTRPAARELTTSQATLEQGWYRVSFTDDAAGLSLPSDPVRNPSDPGGLPPTPDQIRNESPLLRAKFPLTSEDPYTTSDLRNVVYQAVAMVQAITWRLIDPTLGCAAPEDYVCETVPDALVPVAVQAVTRMSERLKITTDPQLAEQIATGRRLRGFSAGPYSESYFAPGEFARRGAQQGRPPMDADDALDVALWALATEDARDYFVYRSTGQALPTGVATVFDYRRESLGYAQTGAWPGGGYAHGGPDGW